jgi:dTDP-glucose 4,6-dehydratase
MAILVTGAAGFIGGNFVLDWLAQSDETVINLNRVHAETHSLVY